MPRKPGTSRAKHTLAMMPQVLPGAGVDGPQPVALTGERLKLWDDVHRRFALEPASENILRNACESLERAAQLSEMVTKHGPTFLDRFGAVRVNPAAQLERDFRGLAARQLQQLAARMEGPVMPRAPAKIRMRFIEGETEVLDPELEETLVWGYVRVLDIFCTMRSIDEWQAAWCRWRDTVLPKVIEHRPGTRPVAAYVCGEIPRREFRINLPEDTGWKHIQVRGRDGKIARHWLDAPPTFLDPEVKHLQRLGLCDADEQRRHRQWVRRGDDPYPLEMSLHD